MGIGFIGRNWKLLAILASIAIVRARVQRRKFIDLQDKVILITGGSRGLGLALAEQFAQEGARLALCARQEDELTQACYKLAALTADVLTLPCDVSSPRQAHQVIEQVIKHYGHIDVLVNNAGIISVGPQQTLTRSDFEESMNTMFWGTFNMTMAILPHMRERKRGRIVNITSLGGKVSVPHLLAYSTAKFATVGFSEGLHAELAKDGIIVTTVAPGLLRTGSSVNAIMKGSKHRTEYALFTLLDTLPASSISVQRAAKQIVRATKRGSTELIITVQAQVMARLHGAFPEITTDILALAHRLLPSSDSIGTERYTGKQSETLMTKFFVTMLGQRASRHYNEL